MTETTTNLIKSVRHKQAWSQQELATNLGLSVRHVGRLERNEVECKSTIELALRQLAISPGPATPTPQDDRFTFIDLFAGIGGIRLGFEAAGGRCVFTSEWNDWSKKTYLKNFPDDPGHKFVGDIVPYPADAIPDHDVLLAGFPCQPFSIAGVSKKNALGRPHGFECTTQGTLFFDVQRIIEAKRPRAFLLENVKNLVSHDRGNTFRVIMQVLKEQLGYHVTAKVIDGGSWVPQHRERILIVGFRDPTDFGFEDLRRPDIAPKLASILHTEDGREKAEEPYTTGELAKVHDKYTLTSNLWRYLQDYAAKHRAAGNGFGYGLVTPEDRARTLSARYYKDGSEILVSRGTGRNPRRLTPRECARLMGFPETFRIPVSDTQAYRQFGNSVIVPVMEEMARIMAPHVEAIICKDRMAAAGRPSLPVVI